MQDPITEGGDGCDGYGSSDGGGTAGVPVEVEEMATLVGENGSGGRNNNEDRAELCVVLVGVGLGGGRRPPLRACGGRRGCGLRVSPGAHRSFCSGDGSATGGGTGACRRGRNDSSRQSFAPARPQSPPRRSGRDSPGRRWKVGGWREGGGRWAGMRVLGICGPFC